MGQMSNETVTSDSWFSRESFDVKYVKTEPRKVVLNSALHRKDARFPVHERITTQVGVSNSTIPYDSQHNHHIKGFRIPY